MSIDLVLLPKFDMKLQHHFHVLLWAIFLPASLIACAPAPSESISLASFTENYVDVSIYLERNSEGEYLVSATFTPPDGFHLYSKDIPISGINGLGRPTLLALTPNSIMKTAGTLVESVKARSPDFEPKELLVYPLGPVTLRLPIELPSGNDWTEDEIQLTYMACSASQCKPPVVAKRVLVPIPGADRLDKQGKGN